MLACLEPASVSALGAAQGRAAERQQFGHRQQPVLHGFTKRRHFGDERVMIADRPDHILI